jgi:hypothetical protein
MTKKLIIILSIAILTSCTNSVGRFTAISTNNVRGLEHVGKNREDIAQVTGKSCEHRIYLSRTVAGFFLIFPWFMPTFDIVFGDPNRRLENSVYKTIGNADKRHVFDGDLLIDANIKEKRVTIPLIYGYNCIITEGSLVSSVTRTKGYLKDE